ncbi:hypothetical protein ACLI09_16595 [Flavobacterium sp. RHBU_24]|uniref:hypothetical protein n=1 Tax=Flavobacterium sp. RHBU_24 TaxID=3391185 RepID=UPI003985012D
MKTCIITFFLVCCSLAGVAQDKPALQAGLDRVYKNTTSGNYEALLNDTYPKIFEVIPKEQMLKSLQGMLNGPGYILDVLDAPANFDLGEIKHIGKGYYCIVKHDLLMKMTFTQPISEAESKTMIQNLKTSMKSEDVTFNPRSNSFTMKTRADIIAISNEFTGGKWKFLNRTGSKIMEKVLAEDVRKALDL